MVYLKYLCAHTLAMSRHQSRESVGTLEQAIGSQVMNEKTLDMIDVLLQTKDGSLNELGALRPDCPSNGNLTDPVATPNIEPEKGEPEYPHGLKLWLVLIALAMTLFLVHLDMTLIATAVPSITDEFHSLADVSWYGSSFFLTLGCFQSTWGKVYTFFPMKTVFLSAVGIFELGSLLSGIARNSQMLIVGRAISGICTTYPNQAWY